MIFRIEFKTYDPNLIDVLTKVKGKTPYLVEKALTYFLASQSGKDVIKALLKDRKSKAKKGVKEIKKEDKKIFIDKFL